MLNFLVYFALFFFGVFVENAFAYLDPGTSSLLLSSVVAIFASIIFAIKGFFYKIASGAGFSLFHRQTKTNNGIVIYSEGRQYFSVFKPIVDVFEKLNYPYTYYTSDEKDPILEFKTELGHIEFIGSANHAYRKLNNLVADVCLVTFPQLNVLQIKCSQGVKHYCHIMHSFQPLDTYEVFALDYFDSVFVHADINHAFIREVEEIRHLKPKQLTIIGSTYLDFLNNKLQAQNFQKPSTNPPTILVAPSWNRNSLFARYGMRLLKPLLDIGYPVIIRPHPQTFISQAELLESLKAQTAHYTNLKWDSRTDNIFAMAESNILIGDFSGVLCDFTMLFDRPVLTLDFPFNTIGYDLEDTSRTEPLFATYLPEISTPITEADFPNLKGIIDSALTDTKKAQSRAAAKARLWQYQGQGGERAAYELLKIHKEILEESLGVQRETLQRIEFIHSKLQALAVKTA